MNKKKIALNISLVLLSVAAVLLIAWTTGPFHYHFASGRLVNIYSYLQLFATAYVSFLICRNLTKENSLRWWRDPSARPFFLSAIGFLYLGLDDLFSIHEAIDDLIHIVLRMKETPLNDHIDDVILLVYLIIAAFFIKDFMREFRKHPFMIGLIVCGLLASVGMFLFDFISNNDETFSYFFKAPNYTVMRHTRDICTMGDSSFQILAEAFFLSAYVAALTHIRIRKNGR